MASLSGLCSSFILKRAKLTSLKSSGGFVNLPQLSNICFQQRPWKLTDEHREEEQFVQHLEVMLGEGVERPGWDLEGRFTPANLQLYFENKSQELVKVRERCKKRI